ncbi:MULTISPECIES: hypothetical protein [Nocardiaceae]|uniref:Uncharacterized protein n=1 Tax=Rhodococcoides kroppenstedtii TaxID=293050 RepID=A0ABS7NTE4_9NOCA|nr:MULTISPECIES: hypothetical protein [Rhodococcus]AMY20722.1 hypothetical protein A3Q40_03361 [Rhodococcus sp. PBTS 1]MBY6313380.1 hypothetical protein [Rhodococcus kroppenstedtii]MBY6321270.1 hypothetical protein [Rhodococcus kroppenstedtii]MBY6400312.1 hypothetical protein [Rhodococcus kroppenstedtii]
MSNSAFKLHDLIMDWTVPPNTPPEQIRFNGDPTSLEFWRSQSRAVELLKDVERAVDGLHADGQDVEMFRDIMPELYQVVFSYSVPWQQINANERPVVDRMLMRLLKSLGLTLQMVNNSLFITGDDITDLLTYLDDAVTLVRESQDIDDAVRRYLLGLIEEARRVANEFQTFGDVELRSVTFELGAALLGAADDQVPEERRAGWLDQAKKLIKKAAVSAGTKALDRGSDALLDGATDAINSAFGG